MISILIPNFNYNCQELVQNLADEAEQLQTEIEIILGDDASTLTSLHAIYHQLEKLPNLQIIKNEINLGREKTRVKLAHQAQFNWLLFLDADVLPKKKNFIGSYIEAVQTHEGVDVVFGGIAYHEKPKNNEYLLRWKYGKAKEEQSLASRKKNRYRSLISGAICIKKSVFLKHSSVQHNRYGLDVFRAYQLQIAKAKVIHIANPVLHLGLETNTAFLAKTKESWKSIIFLENENFISKDFRPVQKAYLKIEKYGLLRFVNLLYAIFKNFLIKKSTGNNPSIFWFDVYRMFYFCHLKTQKYLKNE